jgi:hypothetical protein
LILLGKRLFHLKALIAGGIIEKIEKTTVSLKEKYC